MPSQDELLRGNPKSTKRQGKRPKEKTLSRNAPSPEPPTNDITVHLSHHTQPEPPSPPLPTPAQHQIQPARSPALTPWIDHRQPALEPPQQPRAETPYQGGQRVIRQHTRNQESEPQGPGFEPHLERRMIPKPPDWHTMKRRAKENWIKKHK